MAATIKEIVNTHQSLITKSKTPPTDTNINNSIRIIEEIINKYKEVEAINKPLNNIIYLFGQRHDYLIEFCLALEKINKELKEKTKKLRIEDYKENVLGIIEENLDSLEELKKFYRGF